MAKKLLALPLALIVVGCGSSSSSSPTTPTAAATPVPVVSFAGTYAGTYTFTACGDTGDFHGLTPPFCVDFAVGTVDPMSLTLTQSGSSVRGTLTQGQITTPVTGTVNGSGQLMLSGAGTFTIFNLQIVGWNTTLSGNSLVGSWNTVWTVPGQVGMGQTVQTLNTVTLSSVAKTTLSTRPNQTYGTLQEILQAMKR